MYFALNVTTLFRYDLLQRPSFGAILKAHLQDRKKGQPFKMELKKIE